ncbi:MAG: YibE/F family protein [Firmicutes bacterium]|nr:YibE/F family protein [Bacillota bacterium]
MIKIRNIPGFRDLVFCLIIILLSVGIGFIPMSKYYRNSPNDRQARCIVTRTDNRFVFQQGTFRQGDQKVTVRILDGPDRGKTIEALNMLQGATEMEWFYQTGEKAIIGYTLNGAKVAGARMLEPLRENHLGWLFLFFIIALLILAGWTGVKAIITFIFTILIIWKVLLPYSLEGKIDPVYLAILIVAGLCFITIFMIAGFTKKGLGAFLGAFGGSIFTWIILLLFGGPLKVNGATSSFSTTLRYSGFEHLDLLRLFYAAVILSATGALMDVAIDIAAAMAEIKEKRPDIGRWELIRSGINIGRLVIGTMSTTLLLAYTGGALTMLMFLMAKGISIWRIFNMNYVASELLKTLSGTIGLTLVVPFTAIISGVIMAGVAKESKKADTFLG